MLIYMGPTIVRLGFIFGDVFSDRGHLPVNYRDAECAEVGKMIVPLGDAAKVRRELRTPNSLRFIYTAKIIDYYRKDKK